MRCPNCGSEYMHGATFCGNCGQALYTAPAALHCEQCGMPAAPGQKFCRRCGTRLPMHGAPPIPTTIEFHPSGAAAAAAVRPARPGLFTGTYKGLLKVVIPIVALITSYYANDFVLKTFGRMLVEQFGQVALQVVPVLVFTTIGGIAYKIIRR